MSQPQPQPQPTQKPGFIRRKLIIYPLIQVPLIAWTAGLSLVSAFFVAAFIAYSQNHPDQNELQTKLIFMIIGLLIFSSYAILLSYYTNRLFGPVYRLQVTMRKYAAGENPGPIRLRDGDNFADVIDDFNEMIETRLGSAVKPLNDKV